MSKIFGIELGNGATVIVANSPEHALELLKEHEAFEAEGALSENLDASHFYEVNANDDAGVKVYFSN